MKSLFLYACFAEDLDNLPDDIEYLFINTLIVDTNKKRLNEIYIKPYINPMFKFMYVHRMRIKAQFYRAKINMLLPFGAEYIYNRYTYNLYNFQIDKNLLIHYIDDAENVICKDIQYLFNLQDNDERCKYKTQIFNDCVCIHSVCMDDKNYDIQIY